MLKDTRLTFLTDILIFEVFFVALLKVSKFSKCWMLPNSGGRNLKEKLEPIKYKLISK